MNAYLTFIGVSVIGFLIGLAFTGTWKRPKHSKYAIVFTVKKTKYHIHHWLISVVTIVFILCLSWKDVIRFHDPPIKFLTAFFSGYGLQGLMVKDAFKIKGYDRYLSWKAQVKKSYLAKKKNVTKSYLTKKKNVTKSYLEKKKRFQDRFS